MLMSEKFSRSSTPPVWRRTRLFSTTAIMAPACRAALLRHQVAVGLATFFLRVRADREAACDAQVLDGKPAALRNTLLTIAGIAKATEAQPKSKPTPAHHAEAVRAVEHPGGGRIATQPSSGGEKSDPRRTSKCPFDHTRFV